VNAVYFQPLFDEQKCSYRFSYCLSEAMKQENIILERPDYRGTGDSSLPFCDVTIDTLRQDMDFLISKSTESLIGLRFGASLICDYLSRNQSNCYRVILIDPIFDGQHYIKYLLRKQRLKDHLSQLPTHFHQEEEYANLEGYKTKKCFIDQIESYALNFIQDKVFERHQASILFTSTRLSAMENRVISRAKEHNQIDVTRVQFPDIWERIPVMDYSPLIEPIIGYCNER